MTLKDFLSVARWQVVSYLELSTVVDNARHGPGSPPMKGLRFGMLTRNGPVVSVPHR